MTQAVAHSRKVTLFSYLLMCSSGCNHKHAAQVAVT